MTNRLYYGDNLQVLRDLSTGGFTREAYFEAERAATVTHLMTLDDLARALTNNYEQLDERGRALLPLVRAYWPA